MGGEPADAVSVRTAEVIGALCLATDLGMGFPFEHGLHEALIAMRLAERLDVDRDIATQTYYASLLTHAGCTAAAHFAAAVFGGSLTETFNPLMYGSVPDVLTGLLRTLPSEGSSGLARAAEMAAGCRVWPERCVPRSSASCEVAGMLAAQTARHPRCRVCCRTSPIGGTATVHFGVERTRRSRCPCGSCTSRPMRRSNDTSVACSTPSPPSAVDPDAPSIRKSRRAWSRGARRSSRSTAVRPGTS